MKKSNALMAFAYNVKQLARIPSFIKNTLQSLKGDFQEVKDAMDEIKTNIATYSAHGKACAAMNIKDPVGCYKKVFGPVKYTMKQRKEWDAWMNDFMWNKKGRRYDATKFPLTDLIQDGATAKQ
jgi:hypothetical protein